jgi:hypothetical protein
VLNAIIRCGGRWGGGSLLATLSEGELALFEESSV